jgi:hypothetical protein
MMRTLVLSAFDQCSTGPRDVRAQSNARMRSPISPPPARKSLSEGLVVGKKRAEGDMKTCNQILRAAHGNSVICITFNPVVSPVAGIKSKRWRHCGLICRRRADAWMGYQPTSQRQFLPDLALLIRKAPLVVRSRICCRRRWIPGRLLGWGRERKHGSSDVWLHASRPSKLLKWPTQSLVGRRKGFARLSPLPTGINEQSPNQLYAACG